MPQCSVPHYTEPNGHRSPSNKQQQKAWVIAIRQKGGKRGSLWQPTPSSRVCKRHFTQDDYITTVRTGKCSKLQRLKPDVIPSLNLPKEPIKSPSATQRNLKQKCRSEMERMCADSTCYDVMQVHEELVESEDKQDCTEFESSSEIVSDTQIPTETRRLTTGRTISIQTDPQPLFTLCSMTDDMIHFYTGLECQAKFLMVLQTLGPAQHSLTYHLDINPSISVPNQFLLCLTKLRRHQTNVERSMLFGITKKQVSVLFITWVNFMFYQWKEINWWPDRDTTSYYMPESFKMEFPKTRLIIDGTEVKIRKPMKPRAQQCLFSTYKNLKTLKVMVGISPGGLVTYMSDAYAGSTSDRQIVERSELHKLCDPYDDRMSDKGFNVEDLFIPYHININIPSFFRKKNRMDGRTVLKDRKIASKRVHVERVIGLANSYLILRGPLDPVEVSLATEICSVVFWLCNFRNCIIK